MYILLYSNHVLKLYFISFGLAVVNVVKPLDKSRFNQDVVHEELEKYDGDTMQNLSRAIIDIRKEDSRGKNKA